MVLVVPMTSVWDYTLTMAEPEEFPQLPDVIRTHQIKRYWYDDEESRLGAMEGIRSSRPISWKATEGTDIHTWLENRPKGKAEKILADKLAGWIEANKFTAPNGRQWADIHRPFDYRGQTVRIVAHPDNLRVLYDKSVGDSPYHVQIEEYKTVDRLEKLPDGTKGYPWILKSQAEFQAQIYRWVMGYVLPAVAESPYNELLLSIYKRNGAYPLIDYRFGYMGDPAMEAQLVWIFDGWTKRRLPVIPQYHKCEICDVNFKSRCRIANSGWTFGQRL